MPLARAWPHVRIFLSTVHYRAVRRGCYGLTSGGVNGGILGGRIPTSGCRNASNRDKATAMGRSSRAYRPTPCVAPTCPAFNRCSSVAFGCSDSGEVGNPAAPESWQSSARGRCALTVAATTARARRRPRRPRAAARAILHADPGAASHLCSARAGPGASSPPAEGGFGATAEARSWSRTSPRRRRPGGRRGRRRRPSRGSDNSRREDARFPVIL